MPERQGKRGWRIVRRTGLGLLLLLVVLGGVGALWNALAIRHYRNVYPPPGELYAVSGHLMHLYCSGKGSPTVVLESGLGEDFTVWAKVQPALSRTTRVCSYDRAGFGWSESRPGMRDSNAIADQLHALLRTAGMVEPVVLMGHSAGGLHIRAYASRFPQDVAGLVFVDASSPRQDQKMPPAALALNLHSASEYLLLKSVMALGIARLAGQCAAIPPGFDAYAGWLKANTCVPAQVTSYQREMSALPASLEEAGRIGSLGDLPVLVFSRDPQQGRPTNFPASISPAVFRQVNTIWDGLQEGFKSLSTRSRRIIARGSGHYIHFDRPDLLNREVPSFVQQIRDRVFAPGNDRTKIE